MIDGFVVVVVIIAVVIVIIPVDPAIGLWISECDKYIYLKKYVCVCSLHVAFSPSYHSFVIRQGGGGGGGGAFFQRGGAKKKKKKKKTKKSRSPTPPKTTTTTTAFALMNAYNTMRAHFHQLSGLGGEDRVVESL